jgi:hypothetical protein
MRIICLKSYSNGYTGFIEEKEAYVFFNFSKNGKLTKLLEYNKSDYTGYRHFIANISKFFPSTFFLKEPIPFESLSIAELDRIFEGISDH